MKRLDRLISDISDASRLDAEMSRARMEPVDLTILLQAVAEVYEATRKPEMPVLKLALPGMVEHAEGEKPEPVLVNGDLGLVVQLPDTGETVVASLAVSPDGHITGLYNQLNPAKISLDEF